MSFGEGSAILKTLFLWVTIYNISLEPITFFNLRQFSKVLNGISLKFLVIHFIKTTILCSEGPLTGTPKFYKRHKVGPDFLGYFIIILFTPTS